MPDRKDIILPLYQLFEQLQAYEKKLKHQSLGTDSYFDLVDVLKKGYGLLSVEELYFLVKMIWFKPHFEEIKFRAYFETYLAPFQIAGASNREENKAEPEEEREPEPTEMDSTKPSEETQEEQEEEKTEQEETEDKEGGLEEENFEMVTLQLQGATAHQSQNMAIELANLEKSIYEQPYRLSGLYYPVEKRTIQQNIRSLRILTDKTKDIDIDWERTIDRIANKGYFDEPEMKRVPEISNQLCVLIDNGPSMVAFRGLAEEIALEVKKMQKADAAQVYYFHNCPINYLYKDDIHTLAVPLTTFVAKINQPIFIISDAGAARGRFDRERIQQTQQFLSLLAHKKVAWLNPMPRKRWENTTAAYIAQEIAMFAINPIELGNAIKLFKLKK